MFYQGFMDWWRNFWTPALTLLTLLGVLLIFQGIALAGLVTALKNRARERDAFGQRTEKPG